jgi:hypothetical protein
MDRAIVADGIFPAAKRMFVRISKIDQSTAIFGEAKQVSNRGNFC